MPVFTLFDRHCGTVKLHGVLAGIVMLGACVRVFRLSHFSLWNDELFTRFYPAVFDTAFLWKEGFWLESNPPLFYTLMAGWMHVFGTSEAGLRSFSVVASVVHIPLVYVLGREICSRRVGLIAALLCAFSPISIYFAQEARTYALLSVTTTIALISITRLIGECRRSDSGLPHPSASQKWALVYYALSALLAIYLHATMSIFVLSCAIGVTAVLLASGQTWARRIVLVWLSVNALVFLAALPEALAIRHQMHSHALNWIPSFTLRDVAIATNSVVAGVVTPLKLPGAELTAILLLFLGFAFYLASPTRAGLAVMAIIPALFLLLMSLASILQPVLLSRTASWLNVPFCVAVAFTLTRVAVLQLPMLAMVILTWLVGLGYQFNREDQKEPWREILREIRPNISSADLVVLAPFTSPTGIWYYAPGVRRLVIWDVGSPPNIEDTFVPAQRDVHRVPLDSIVYQINRGQQVWLIGRYPDLPWLPKLLDVVPPPRQRLEGRCGPDICLVALFW